MTDIIEETAAALEDIEAKLATAKQKVEALEERKAAIMEGATESFWRSIDRRRLERAAAVAGAELDAKTELPDAPTNGRADDDDDSIIRHIARVNATMATAIDAAKAKKKERDRAYRERKRGNAQANGIAADDDRAAELVEREKEVRRRGVEIDEVPAVRSSPPEPPPDEPEPEPAPKRPRREPVIERDIEAVLAAESDADAKPSVLDRIVDHATGKLPELEPGLPPWTSEDLERELRHALKHRRLPDSRWKTFARDGATTADIRSELCRQWPAVREHVPPARSGGKLGYTIQCASDTPYFWLGSFRGVGHEATLSGSSLVHRIRDVLAIPAPAPPTKADREPVRKRKGAPRAATT